MAVAVVVITCPVSRIDDWVIYSAVFVFVFGLFSLLSYHAVCYCITILRCDVCQRCNVTETVSCVVVMWCMSALQHYGNGFMCRRESFSIDVQWLWDCATRNSLVSATAEGRRAGFSAPRFTCDVLVYEDLVRMPPQQNFHVDAIIHSLQLLAVNHSVRRRCCIKVNRPDSHRVQGHKSINLSA